MKMGKVLAFLPLAFILTSCSINYVGKYYPPTTHVDLYFSGKDIKKPYEVMGQAIETAPDIINDKSMQEYLQKKGCKVGADAILIKSFKEIKVGETTNYSDHEDTTIDVHTRKHHHHKHKEKDISTDDFGLFSNNGYYRKTNQSNFFEI